MLGILVLSDPTIDLPLAAMLLGLILMPISMALRIRLNAWQDHVVITRIISVLTVLATLVAMLPALMLASVSTPYLLKPANASGTRVLVVNHSFLLLGSGDVYVVDRGAVVPQHIGSYMADDGYDPIASNTYTLSWQGETPQLTLHGTENQPVEYSPDDAKGAE